MKLRLAAAAIFTLILGIASTAEAVNYGGIGGSPAYPRADNPRTRSIFIYTLKPGQQATDGVRVINDTPFQQTIALDAVDSQLASGGNFTCRQAADPKTDVGSWIQLSSPTVTVGPSSSQVVPFTVSVPNTNTIDVGEHDGCITLQAASQTASQKTTSGILLSFRTGIRVAVQIPGKVSKRLAITKVSAMPSGAKYQITPVLSNTGNVSLDSSLNVKLVSLAGLSASDVHEGTLAVLPHSVSSNNYNVSKPFWGGFYAAQVTVSYNANPLTGLGLGQNQSQQTIAKSSSWFFVMPSPLAAILYILLLLALAYGIYWYIRQLHHKRHVDRHWQEYIVQHGDDIEDLGRARQVSWKTIAKVNRLKAPYKLRKGQKLKLPADPKD